MRPNGRPSPRLAPFLTLAPSLRTLPITLILGLLAVLTTPTYPSAPTGTHPLLPAQPFRGTLVLQPNIKAGWTFSTTTATTNTFVYDLGGFADDLYVIVDAETWFAHAQVTRRFSTGAAVAVETYITGLYGGILDAIIPEFHHLFGFRNAGREYRPRFEVEFYNNPNGEEFGVDRIVGVRDQTGLAASVVGLTGQTAAWKLRETTDGPGVTIRLSGTVRVAPVSQPAFAAILIQGQISAERHFPLPWIGDVGGAIGTGPIGYIPFSDAASQLYKDPIGANGWLQLIWPFNQRGTLRFVGSANSAPFGTGHIRTDGVMFVLETGMNIDISRDADSSTVLRFGFTEELPPFSAPDFGVFLGVEHGVR